MQQKKDFFGTTFLKKRSYAVFFVNVVPKDSFASNGTFSIKLIGV